MTVKRMRIAQRITVNLAKLLELLTQTGRLSLTVLMCCLPNSSVPQWIWSQFTLADHAFVSLGNALYLIFKFAVAHRQSFDDDIRAIRHIQACGKQTRTNLEFVHNAHRTLSLYAPNWGQVYAKGTATRHLLGRGIPHVICAGVIRRARREISTKTKKLI